MKTAISVPDDVFAEGERYARKSGKTRSQLYSEALLAYLIQRTPEAITRGWNEACDAAGQEGVGFVKAAARRLLRREEW